VCVDEPREDGDVPQIFDVPALIRADGRYRTTIDGDDTAGNRRLVDGDDPGGSIADHGACNLWATHTGYGSQQTTNTGGQEAKRPRGMFVLKRFFC
jgi:hypothetical protein